MSADDVKLLPCPFCGNADEPAVWDMDYHEQEYQEYDIRYTVVCDKSRNGSNDVHSGCGADCGSYETPTKAIEAWNRRAQSAPQWIPCSERLPAYAYPGGTHILARDAMGNISSFTTDVFLTLYEDGMRSYEHWMPTESLPEPPKEPQQ